MKHELTTGKANMIDILEIRSGQKDTTRCGVCDYCKTTKVLSEMKEVTSIY